MADAILTAARLRELVSYNPDTGEFTRLKDVYRSPQLVGKPVASRPHKIGYIYISVDGKKYLAHRLAWLYVYGEWPAEQIDHINMVRSDNRIANLRAVSNRVNGENKIKPQSHNRIGLRGVSEGTRGRKWRARITVHGVDLWLGRFDTPEEAYAAYLAAKRKYHEGCTI